MSARKVRSLSKTHAMIARKVHYLTIKKTKQSHDGTKSSFFGKKTKTKTKVMISRKVHSLTNNNKFKKVMIARKINSLTNKNMS